MPSSGWCRLVTFTCAGVQQGMYVVCDDLPVGQNPAVEVAAKLILDEARVARAGVTALAGVVEKRLKVVADHAVEDGSLGLMPAIGSGQGG